jgi:tetratricopeptide (TPR) repeat protein
VAAVHFELKQFRSAIEYFTKAIQLDPAQGLAYYNRSDAKHKLGDIGGAIADLKMPELKPGDIRRLITPIADLSRQ